MNEYWDTHKILQGLRDLARTTRSTPEMLKALAVDPDPSKVSRRAEYVGRNPNGDLVFYDYGAMKVVPPQVRP